MQNRDSVALYKVTTDREACSLHLQDLTTRIWNKKVVSLTDKASDYPGKVFCHPYPKLFQMSENPPTHIFRISTLESRVVLKRVFRGTVRYQVCDHSLHQWCVWNRTTLCLLFHFCSRNQNVLVTWTSLKVVFHIWQIWAAVDSDFQMSLFWKVCRIIDCWRFSVELKHVTKFLMRFF